MYESKSYRIFNGPYNLYRNLSSKKNQKYNIGKYDNIENEEDKEYITKDFDYPLSLLGKFNFNWVIRIFRNANQVNKLKLKHLGNFDLNSHPDNYLKKIKPKWEEYSKKSGSYTLFKAIIMSNLSIILYISFLGMCTLLLENSEVYCFNQIIMYFDRENKDNNIYFSLIDSCVLLLCIRLIYIYYFRYAETVTYRFSYEIIMQLNTLIYDKILILSSYADVSEGDLVNFIQIDAEKFAEFLSYIPALFIYPIELIVQVVVLFYLLGKSFISGFIILIILTLVTTYLTELRFKYQKIVSEQKDRRMNTTSQAFNMIKVLKMYSWEDFFYDKIIKERELELETIAKIQKLNLFINFIFWSISPISCLVSLFTYIIINNNISVSCLLTVIYIMTDFQEYLFLIPEYIGGLIDSLNAVKRIQNFMKMKEYNSNQVEWNIKKTAKYKKNKDDNKYINKNECLIDICNENTIDDNNNEYDFNKNYKISNIEDDNINKNKTDSKIRYNTIYNEENSSSDEINNNKRSNKIAIEINNIDFGIIITKEEQKLKFESEELRTNSNEDNENYNEKRNKKDDKKEALNTYIKLYMKEDTDIIIPLLKNIKLKIKEGTLVGIIGKVASGKTSLINAILNDLDILNKDNSKKIYINGTIAYAAQTPIILNSTIRKNIIFNEEYDSDFYNKVVEFCQLQSDFDMLTDGDMTEIGDKGMNLSGGQKTRVSIARAVYSKADIYIFDDPLSTLDAYVGNNIFNLVFKNFLKSKTVLVATHAYQYISQFDKVIKMNNGQIEWIKDGKEAAKEEIFNENLEKKGKNKKFKEDTDDLNNDNKSDIKDNNYKDSETENAKSDLNDTDMEKENWHAINSFKKNKDNKKIIFTDEIIPKKITFFYTIKNFIKLFIHSGGIFFLIFVFLTGFIWKICELASNYIISDWASQNTNDKDAQNIYLILYITLSVLSLLFLLIRAKLIANGIVDYNRNMHKELLYKLIKAPINLFHDIVPKGKILNRLSKDLDNSIKCFWSFNQALTLFFHVFGCLLTIIILNTSSIIVILFILISSYYLIKYYHKGNKELISLESEIRNPIITSFSETLNGITTFRAFGNINLNKQRYFYKLFNFFKILIYENGVQTWIAQKLDLIIYTLIYYIISGSYLKKDYIKPQIIGLLLNYSLRIIRYSFNFYEQLGIFQRMLNSLVNCEKYTHIVQERKSEEEGDQELMSLGFPQNGKIEFKDYSVRYRPNTDIVLKDINFTILSGEKIGVVGRTGSGKSTLCLSLFRLLEAEKGKIEIAGVDISKIGLKYLRQKITVIPQEPILIEGTLRDNLDPTHNYKDEELLFTINLIRFRYEENEKVLDREIKEKGDNLSVGERQLICIARALLRKSKIVIMDEATANVDRSSEKLIQQCIYEKLKESTVITIAHRIKTVMVCNRIFVFSAGKLVEEGKPMDLIKNKSGMFYELYNQCKV